MCFQTELSKKKAVGFKLSFWLKLIVLVDNLAIQSKKNPKIKYVFVTLKGLTI